MKKTDADTRPGDYKSRASALAPRLCDVREAGAYLAVSPWTVRELIWRGDLPSVRVGRLVRLDVRDLEAYITGNRQRERP